MNPMELLIITQVLYIFHRMFGVSGIYTGNYILDS